MLVFIDKQWYDLGKWASHHPGGECSSSPNLVFVANLSIILPSNAITRLHLFLTPPPRTHTPFSLSR